MKLMIGTPAYGGNVTVQYFGSMLQLANASQRRGLEIDVRVMGNESLITRARNILVHFFLKSDCTHLMFIDADIGFDADSVFGMLEADKDVIAGVYPKKAISWERVGEAARANEKNLAEYSGEMCVNFASQVVEMRNNCIPVLDAATGFMLIKRSVIEKLIESHPETLYESDHPGMMGEPMHAIFDCIISDKRYLSEDYTFCRRWQAIGGEAHIYVPAFLTHTGAHTFTGTLATCLHPHE